MPAPAASQDRPSINTRNAQLVGWVERSEAQRATIKTFKLLGSSHNHHIMALNATSYARNLIHLVWWRGMPGEPYPACLSSHALNLENDLAYFIDK